MHDGRRLVAPEQHAEADPRLRTQIPAARRRRVRLGRRVPTAPGGPLPSPAHIASPARAAPMLPLTKTMSPGRAPARVSTRRGLYVPMTITSTTSGPGERDRFPPTTVVSCRRASASSPSTRPSNSVSGRRPGMASESVARRGVAPIAARSLKLTASARWPMAPLGTNRRSKCTPSTDASVVMTSSSFRFGLTTAPSSPGPTRSQSGARGRRLVIRSISSCSPRSATVTLADAEPRHLA